MGFGLVFSRLRMLMERRVIRLLISLLLIMVSQETNTGQERRESADAYLFAVPPLGYSYAGSYDPMAQDKPVYGLELDDTDTNAALLSALPQAKYPFNIPQVGIVLSTTDQAPPPYFNSSACAIRDAYTRFYNSLPEDGRNIVQRNITARGMRQANDTQRTEFRVDGLQPGTNYTAWLTTDPTFPPQGNSFFYGPAVKFKTKTSGCFTFSLKLSRADVLILSLPDENCRLLSSVDFCPDLAYATPIGPDVSTDDAVASVNTTIFPVFQNFTRTLRTFACDSDDFGQYSYIATCNDCEAAYKRWACSVAFPRCVDTVTNTSQSAASQDGRDLTGAVRGVNSQLNPYIVNRQDSTRLNTSVGVQGSYGELLPCLDVCNFVSIMCPPLISWVCPVWDITAQRDYGTFADANAYGFGPYGTGDDDDSPRDGKVFGGVQRYVATDGFGNAYCNALGVDRFLRQNNGATASFQGASQWMVLAACASVGVISFNIFVA
jgi:calcium channel MID1